MKFYEIERIKKLLGLPASASNRDIEARLAELMEKEQKLEVMSTQAGEQPKKSWRWWK
ncbi:MAG: hypothetical protein WAU47_01090 [Desulfobaccales bacterium]